MDEIARIGEAAGQGSVPAPGHGPAAKTADLGVSDIFGIGMRICNSVHEHARAARGTGRSYVLSDMVRNGDGIVFATREHYREFLDIQEKRGRDINIDGIIVDPKLGLVGVERSKWSGRKYKRLFFDHVWLEEYYAYAIADMQRRIAVTAGMYSTDGL